MNSIRIEATNKVLSAHGGLLVHRKIIDKLNIEKQISKILPKLKAQGKGEQWDKVLFLMIGFCVGAECLDDLGYYSQDPAIQILCPRRYAPNTVGEFLRSFDKRACEGLQKELIDLALRLRFAVEPRQKEFILALDSTKHPHCGRKFEGLELDYKGRWSLDSLQAYDDKGFQYWFDLRPGATHTAEGAVEAFTTIFQRVKALNRKIKKILLADSGYCTLNVFNGCFHAGAKFVITLTETMFNPREHQIQNWKATKLKSHDGRECEIGSTVFYHKECHEPLRIVALRAKFKDELLNGYDYFHFVTNIGQHELSNEKVIKLYRRRAHIAENHIRETKNGLDLKHFPCQKLLANNAYGLIGALSYNILRYSAFVEDSLHPKFAKLLRFRLVDLACEVVTHARQATFRFMTQTAKEVCYWIQKIHKQLIGEVRCLE